MNMKTEHIIGKLLFEHDCVIIPGFGGFIGNYSPASILSSNHTFLPPYKSFLFNINLRQNDGLLANRLSAYKHITYQEAMDSIETMVKNWMIAMNSGQVVAIDQVGQLYRDSEGNLQFLQSMEINYLPESYGLSSFISPAIRRDNFQRKLEKRVSVYLDPSHNKRRILPKALKWAAILVVPLGAAAIFGITHFDRIRSLSADYAGILIPESVKISQKPRPSLTRIKNNPAPLQVARQVVPVPVMTESPEKESSAGIVKPEPFAIIVGAFRFKENAENLVTDLKQKGYDAAIVGQTKTGLYRVKLRSFSERNEAVQQLALVRSSEFSGAWILVKQD